MPFEFKLEMVFIGTRKQAHSGIIIIKVAKVKTNDEKKFQPQIYFLQLIFDTLEI